MPACICRGCWHPAGTAKSVAHWSAARRSLAASSADCVATQARRGLRDGRPHRSGRRAPDLAGQPAWRVALDLRSVPGYATLQNYGVLAGRGDQCGGDQQLTKQRAIGQVHRRRMRFRIVGGLHESPGTASQDRLRLRLARSGGEAGANRAPRLPNSSETGAEMRNGVGPAERRWGHWPSAITALIGALMRDAERELERPDDRAMRRPSPSLTHDEQF